MSWKHQVGAFLGKDGVALLDRVFASLERDSSGGELYEEAVDALPALFHRLLFVPPGTRLRLLPPQFARCFAPGRLALPRDARDVCVRLVVNGYRFRAEYRFATACAAVGWAFYDGCGAPLPWLAAELGARLAARRPPSAAYPSEGSARAGREAAAARCSRSRLAGRRCVARGGRTGTVVEGDGRSWLGAPDLALCGDDGSSEAFDQRKPFVFLTPRDALYQGRYVLACAVAAYLLAPRTAQTARRAALLCAALHSAARAAPRSCRRRVDEALDEVREDPRAALEGALRDGLESFYVIADEDTRDYEVVQ